MKNRENHKKTIQEGSNLKPRKDHENLYKPATPSNHYYLVWIFLDSKIYVDTSTLPIGNSDRRKMYLFNLMNKRETGNGRTSGGQ
jgi:hypothetical protein